METTIYSSSVWNSWSKIMGKTFDEYWLETKQDYLSDLYTWAISPDIYGDLNPDLESVKSILSQLWNDSRQNMTTKDV